VLRGRNPSGRLRQDAFRRQLLESGLTTTIVANRRVSVGKPGYDRVHALRGADAVHLAAAQATGSYARPRIRCGIGIVDLDQDR
jgi:hypothetical protein